MGNYKVNYHAKKTKLKGLKVGYLGTKVSGYKIHYFIDNQGFALSSRVETKKEVAWWHRQIEKGFAVLVKKNQKK